MDSQALQELIVLLLVFGVPVVIWVALANAVGNVAQRKGLSHAAFFFFALLFSPLIGWIVAEVASPRSGHGRSMGGSKKCPDCAESIKSDARKCRFCGKDLAATPISTAPPAEVRPQDIAPSQFGRLGTAPMDAGYEVGTRSNSLFGWIAGIIAAMLIVAILYMATFR